ncbi:MAG: Rv2732c family membrane protein, partial [Sciscionella sp.]
REQIDEVGRRSEHRFDPGMRAVLIAAAILVLLVAATLPFTGDLIGWQVLFGHAAEPKVGGIAPRVFLIVATLFGVLGSVMALAIRRYGAAWICSLGADLSVLFGGLSIWSQQTSASHQPGPGPGPGLILALLAMVALAILWGGIAWRKPPSPTRADR